MDRDAIRDTIRVVVVVVIFLAVAWLEAHP